MKSANYNKAFLILVVAFIGLIGVLSVPQCKFFGGSIPNYVPLGIFLSLVFANVVMKYFS